MNLKNKAHILEYLIVLLSSNYNVSGYITSKTSSEIIEIPDPPEPATQSQRTNCPHLQTGLLSWNDPSTWSGEGVPSEGEDVTLPLNSKVLVSQSIPYNLGVITIPESSELIFDENEEGIEIHTNGIDVKGALHMGSETCLIEKYVKVVLHGSRPDDIYENPKPMSFKGISATGNGTLNLHGKRYFRTWTRLAETVLPGSKKMILQHNVNWESGQEIILVTTAVKDAREFNQNEVIIVDYVESHPLEELGSIVHLKTAVEHTHLANTGYQAEVGLLSRNIIIAGGNDSDPSDPDPGNCVGSRSVWGNKDVQCPNKELTGFGGHIIIANGGKGFVEGVELYKMGQTNVLGRYPMHFHVLGNDCPGCYFRYSSVHQSFYRCISIHGTNNISVTENVAYDITGFCYYLEDGVEEDNTISFNLAAHIHYLGDAPWGNGQTTGLNYQSSDLLLPADVTASGYYITNVHNNIIGNAASGGWAGFAFPVLSKPIGMHKTVNMRPSSRTSLTIDGNTAHSSGWWWYHAPAFYFGGSLFYASDGKTLVYNAGRDQSNRRSPCNKDWCAAGNCNGYCQPEDQSWIRITNSKAFLVPSVGLNSWSGRMEVIKYEAHDVGLALEALESGFWIDQMLVVCRTGESWQLPSNSYAYKMKGDGFFWYDTNQEHIITNSTFRNCGYRSDSYNQYDTSPTRGCDNNPNNGCQSGSTTFGFLTHSDQHTPEIMQGTRKINFQNCGRRFKLHNYRGVSSPSTVSGRGQNWLDVDGSITGFNEPSLIGSGLSDAGLWWTIDSDVVHDPQGPLKFIKQNNGPERSIGHFKMSWDDSQHNQVGGALCGNGNLAPCPALGYMKHLGSLFDYDNGLPVTANADIVGPTGGFGWLLKLNNGAPHTLKLEYIEVSPDSPLLLSLAYPPGTGLTITANAAWCSPSKYYSCKETFSAVSSIGEVRNSLGNAYHIDSNGLLTVRVIQTPQSFIGDPEWLFPDYDTPGKWGSWYAVDRFSRNGVFLPKFTNGPWLDILADCPRSGAYCSEKPINNMSFDVCPQGYTQTAYDKCCNPTNCLYADGTTEPVASPTNSPTNTPSSSPTGAKTLDPTPSPTRAPTASPTSLPTSSPTSFPTSEPTSMPTSLPTSGPTPTEPPIPAPTIFTDPPTYSPTPQPTECVDNPNDKFFHKTKKRNNKPIYRSCKWLAKKKSKQISKICTKFTESYNGTGPAKDVCKKLCGTCSTAVNSERT